MFVSGSAERLALEPDGSAPRLLVTMTVRTCRDERSSRAPALPSPAA
jgi:hypothetical protein